MTTYDSITKRFNKNVEIIDDIRDKYPNLDSTLYQNLYKYVLYDYKSNKSDEYSFIENLPNKLKNDLVYKMYKKFLTNFTFFKRIKNPNEDFNSKLLLSMRPIRLYKGELLFKEQSRVDELIFVKGYSCRIWKWL